MLAKWRHGGGEGTLCRPFQRGGYTPRSARHPPWHYRQSDYGRGLRRGAPPPRQHLRPRQCRTPDGKADEGCIVFFNSSVENQWGLKLVYEIMMQGVLHKQKEENR